MTSVIKHSDNKEFGTPGIVYSKLCEHSQIFPKLDICASEINHMCLEYYTKEQDAFNFEWTKDMWANIPFGSKVVNPNAKKQLNYGLVEWVKRIHNQSKTYDVSALVLLPLSASIIAKFHHYCEVIVIENRITFFDENRIITKYPIGKDLMSLAFRSTDNKSLNPNRPKLSSIRI